MISVIKAVEWLAPKHCENFLVQDKKKAKGLRHKEGSFRKSVISVDRPVAGEMCP